MSANPVGRISLKVAGTELPAAAYDELLDARVEQSIRVPDMAVLRFSDPYFELFDADRFPLGAALELTFRGGDHEEVITDAEVTAVAMEPGADRRHELVVTALGRGHCLARGSEVQTYVDQTDADVARTVAQRVGLKADVDATSTRHPYLVQTGTAYELLTERAYRIGYRLWVSDGTLHFKKATTGTAPEPLAWGANLQSFSVRCSAAESLDDITVRSWDPSQQQAISGQATLPKDLHAVGSDAPAAAQLLAQASKSGRFGGSGFCGAIPVDDAHEAEALAGALALRAADGQFRARGQAIGDPRLRAGATVEIDGVGTRLSGRYLLATTEHIVGAEQPYVVRFTVGGRDGRSISDLLGRAGRAGAPAGTRGWGDRGLVIGVVTNVKDPEGFGRVRLKFPTLGDKDESAWARVLGAGAGKARGFQVPYGIDDEVLVGFEHGELRRPVILGGLWSGRNAIPRRGVAAIDDAGHPTAVWQSKAGHIVELKDAAGANDQHVLIALSDGKTKVRIGADAVEITTPNPLTITADRSIAMTTKGDFTVEAANITLKAKAKLAAEGTQIEATGRSMVKLSGLQTRVEGSSMLSLSGGAMTEVKGAIVKLN
jgi:phage protein D/phage baseplate assembly protein gpV